MPAAVRRKLTRLVAALALGVCALVAFVLVAVMVVSNTDWGREQVRRRVVALLDQSLAGRFAVGRLEGNLLSGVRLVDVRITDTTGQHFLSADTLATEFRLLGLLRQRIQLRDVRLVRPYVVLDQSPVDSTWNWARIFMGDTTARDTAATGPGWGDWIRLDDVELVEGRLTVRMPWTPETGLAGAARDSAIAAALADSSRAVVEEVPGGYQTVYDFQRLSARLPLLRVADPGFDVQRYEIERLTTIAFPFRPPPVVVEHFAGELLVSGDSLWFQDAELHLPGTRAVAGMRVGLGDRTDVALALRADTLSLADLRWLYPPLPDSGGGRLALDLSLRNDSTRILARDVRLAIGASRLTGQVGMLLANDTLEFTETDLDTPGFRTELVQAVAPGLELPRHGTIAGSARLDGPLAALRLDADLSFTDEASGTSRLLARGELGLVGDGELRAEGLEVELRPLQVALAGAMMPDLPVGGTVTGSAAVSGSTARGFRGTFDLVHAVAGERSRLTGTGMARLHPATYVDVDAQLAPLDLTTVGRFAPDAGLRGRLAGPVRLQGPLHDLAMDARLAVEGGGTLMLSGRADVQEPGRAYALSLAGEVFDANAILERAPRTSLTFTGRAEGTGIEPATMQATAALDLAASRVDTAAVDSARVRLHVADGLATVDTLRLWGPTSVVAAGGTFGLTEQQTGTLAFRVRVDSLRHFAGYLPPDTTVVSARPAVVARRRAAARADSARAAEQIAVEQLALGRRAEPTTTAVEPAELARDSLSGSLYAAGVVRGNTGRVDVSGRLGVLDLVALGNTAREARVAFAWAGGLTDSAELRATASADEVLVGGFALDSLTTDVVYRGASGTVAARVWQDALRDYVLAAGFELAERENSILLEELALRFDSTTWRSVRETAIRFGDAGIRIDSLELRDGDEGRIFANGLLPRSGTGRLDLSIRELPIGQLMALLQEDAGASGLLSVDLRLEGAAENPTLRGAVAIFDGGYRQVPLPSLRATFRYADRRLTTELEGVGRFDSPVRGERLLTATATIPVNLALAGEVQERLPDEPIQAVVNADSLPLTLLAAALPDMVSGMAGTATGNLTVGGTMRSPELRGLLTIEDGVATVIPLGVTLSRVSGRIRLEQDTVLVDSLVGYSRGRVLVRGGIGIDSIAAPSFDLYLVADNAHLLDNDVGDVYVDAGVAMRGPYDAVYVSGAVRVREGVFYIPETESSNLIPANDPAIFAVADSALLAEDVVTAGNPLLENMRMDVNLLVDRGTWIRSREANVEIYTPDESGPVTVRVDQARGVIVLEGVVSTERGTYEFLGRRFELGNGSVVFIGTPEINPTLQLAGEYVVRAPAREALTIRILIGGTLRQPLISLESDAQPPMSQSDLLSYLALGQSSTSLLQQQGSSVTGGGSGGLVGTASEVVTQRIPAFALNVLFSELVLQQFESSAGRRLGADVFNITPADVPIEAAASNTESLNSFLVGTEFEVGRYFTPRTFVSVNVRPSFVFRTQGTPATQPGVRLQFRPRAGVQLEATFEPRFLLREPTLETLNVETFESRGVLGLFLTREWRW